MVKWKLLKKLRISDGKRPMSVSETLADTCTALDTARTSLAEYDSLSLPPAMPGSIMVFASIADDVLHEVRAVRTALSSLEDDPATHEAIIDTLTALDAALDARSDLSDSITDPDAKETYDTIAAAHASSAALDAVETFLSRFGVLCETGSPPADLVNAVHELTTEIIKYLARHPRALHQIKPRQFEELVAEILLSFGWEVNLTRATRDGGYDIFAISRDPVVGVETSWIIECKKFSPENKVGVDIVRALYGLKLDLGVSNAMLATTSHFSKDAYSFKAERYGLDLKDYEDILEWLNTYRPNPNGRLYIKDNRLMIPDDGEK